MGIEKNIIEQFYTAFHELNANEMVKHYHPDVVFEDPAFGVLKGSRASSMWRMLLKRTKEGEFTVNFKDVKLAGDTGEAKWEAFYTFSKTGRKVHNKVRANFIIKDGLIIKHTDRFNMNKWAWQAMGFKGLILGGTSFFKKKLQAQTNKTLDLFVKRYG